MTAEWIDGVRLSNRPAIRQLMGEDSQYTSAYSSSPSSVELSPAEELADAATASLPVTQAPLKGGVKAVMQTMVELFSAQMFNWGWVHCDPHPGNVIIREHPTKPGKPQLVLLDHGLYVRVEVRLLPVLL